MKRMYPAGSQNSVTLWRNISFLLMWSSVAASGFGDRLIMLAAEPMLGVYDKDVSAAKISAGIQFFFLLPYMVLTVVGGWLADRLPRKWLMLGCDEARAAVLFIAFVIAPVGVVVAVPIAHHWKIYLIIAATGCFAAIFNPTRQSVLPQIVATNHLQQANAVLAAIALIASLIGFGVGGPLIQEHSVGLGILIGALSYLISGWFFAFLRVAPHAPSAVAERPSVFVQMIEALGFMRRHRTVRNLVLLNILFWSAVWVVNAAVAALNKGYYGLPNDQYLSAKATMMVAFGAGTIGGSVLVMWLRTRRESGPVIATALTVAGLCMTGLALNRSYGLGLAIAFATG
ncbi:MAG: MFS transporter, partial [Phycisphaeraceae bacterium]